MRWIIPLLVCAQVVSAQPTALADQFGSGTNTLVIDFVTVGNMGNAPDTTGYGAVPYSYRIGKYEISQDAINKATASGAANLTAGPWTGKQPAANVTWYEAAAFVNWLNTSRGYQAAYNLTFSNGAWSMAIWSSGDAWTNGGTNLYRHKRAHYFLPSEDEWYKAAYYNPNGSNYFLYPTASSTTPTAVNSGTNAGTAVYQQTPASGPAEVDNAGGLSTYGTMGQGGNVLEWKETAYNGLNSSANDDRTVRGGAYYSPEDRLASSGFGQTRFNLPATVETDDLGFRVASVSENLYAESGLAAAATLSPFDPSTATNWGSGGTPWIVDVSVSHNGADSIKAQTTDGQSTYREYTLTGPAVVDFWWKVSSELGFDFFSYSLNGVQQQAISGEVDWTYRTLTLPEGTHTIRWTYSKDDSGGIGQDAGWLDDFAIYPATATLGVRDGATAFDGSVTVDFGDADIGSSGFTKSLTFSNEGFVPLEVELSLPEDSPFTFEGGFSSYPLLIGRGESVAVPISLSTAVRGTKTAQLTILAPDSTTPAPQITLTGVVLGPVIGVSAAGAPITSGQSVDLGLAPRTLQFTISNTGNVGDLLISDISVTGNFQITQQPQASIPPQGNTTFTVLAQGGTSGVQSGTVTITSNDSLSETFSFSVGSKSLFSIGQGIAADSVATSGTGGASGWDFASAQLPDGSTGQALKTGATPNSGGSALEMVTETAGVVSWTWKVSTQENFDWLLCEVDGREAAGISTKNGVWQTQVVQVPAGANIRWVYRKDGSGSIGEDAGYLSDVAFTPMSGGLSFAEWSDTHSISDPRAAIPKLGINAMTAWLGGVDPSVGPDADHYKPTIEGGRLKYRFPISKGADGTQQIQFSSDLSSWTSRGMSHRVLSEDGNRMIVEATAPSGSKGFFKVVGSGNTSGVMIRVQGGTLPQSSALAGTTVATFQIGRTEVTWAEWQEVRQWAVANDYDLAAVGDGSGPNYPVHSVNWYDVVKWCNARSEMKGLAPVYTVGGAIYRTGTVLPTINASANGYRLPSEAEWEWAARGGANSQGYTYSGSNDLNSVAWNYLNSAGATVVDSLDGGGTWPVGTKAANELSIHDMSGNVWEWCQDVEVANIRPVRGGAFQGMLGHAVDYHYYYEYPSNAGMPLGFRLARNAED